MYLKEIPNSYGSNYDYHFIIKELAEEFEEQFNCLGENTEKYITFSVSIDKKLREWRKNGEKLYHIDHNLLTAQDLWQAHYQILSIILLQEFVKLNVQSAIHVILNTKTLRMI